MIHDETTTNKLLIMFVLDKLEIPINEDLFVKICTYDNTWMNYMICKTVLHELLTSGFVTKINSNNAQEPLLTLTNDGRTCLAHFYNDIPLSVRENIAETIRNKRISYRKKQEFQADYFRNADGTFTMSLKILDAGAQPSVDLKYVVANRAVATSVYNSWCDKAPEVYQALYEILVGN